MTKWQYLKQTESFKRYPLRTVARLAAWRVRCALHMPVTISLCKWGVRLFLPAQWRGVAKLVYTFRERYEPEMQWLRRQLRPGDVMVDVGACHGIYTVLGAARVGRSGTVVALEPARESFRVLQRNVALNKLTNVIAICAAAAESNGVATLYHDPDSSRNSLGRTRGQPEDSELVDTTTIDSLFMSHSITRLDLLKIDAEGAEAKVLGGAVKTLRAWHPAVLLEVNPGASEELGSSSSESLELLEGMGYKFFRVQQGRPEILSGSPRGGNVVALWESASLLAFSWNS